MSPINFDHRVLDNLSGCHHYLILISKTNKPGIIQYSDKFQTDLVDWTFFKLLTQDYPIVPVDDAVENLHSLIKHAAESSIPISKGSRGKVTVPWLNNDCRNAQSQRNRAERALKRNNTLCNKIAYQRTSVLCRKVFKIAQKQS